jgi:mRNA-degrading endonuclease YafQ of YafQ-DinJ toxin-antitoxin module
VYRITLHQNIQTEDLPFLPEELREDFIQYQRILMLDPLKNKGIPSHKLHGNLKNHRAMEIECNGVSYRLIYRIYESPSPKRVQIISFAEHDLSYERAKKRKYARQSKSS